MHSRRAHTRHSQSCYDDVRIERRGATSSGLWRPAHSSSDLFEESDDIFAYVRQADNDVVVVDVAERGVVAALTPRLVQHQVPAVHRRQEVLVLSGMVMGKKGVVKFVFL